MNNRTLRKLVALVTAVMMLVLAPAALAQNSSVETYGGSGGGVQSEVEQDASNQQAPAAEPSDEGPLGLPFSGLDLGLAVAGAVILIAVGALIARLVPRQEVH